MPASPALPDLVIPRSLMSLVFDCEAAETVRLLVDKAHGAAPDVEVGFYLWGDPPTPWSPARVTDVQPLDSVSSTAEVCIMPEAMLEARSLLLARHVDRGDRIIGIAHSHPGPGRPRRSRTDAQLHRDCLDLHRRRDLLVTALTDPFAIDGLAVATAVEFQVFYSVIFPATGLLHDATAYLLGRVLDAGDDDLELQIQHGYPETLAAARRVGGIDPQLIRHPRGVTIRWVDAVARTREAAP